jgi:hypothetical protein
MPMAFEDTGQSDICIRRIAFFLLAEVGTKVDQTSLVRSGVLIQQVTADYQLTLYHWIALETLCNFAFECETVRRSTRPRIDDKVSPPEGAIVC